MIPDAKKSEFKDFMRDVAPEGHAVVKVQPGGSAYRLYTLTAADESLRIIATKDFSPCKAG